MNHWTTKEVSYVLGLYNEGQKTTDIKTLHDQKYPERSLGAIMTRVYSREHVKRKHFFTEEQNAWIRTNLSLKPRHICAGYVERFGDVNTRSLKFKIYEFRKEARP